MPKIVIVGTNAKQLEGGYPTGAWLEEIAVPYYTFRNAKYQVIVSSPQGGEIPLDANSLKGDFYTTISKQFMEDDPDQPHNKLTNSLKLSEIDFSTVDCIYLAGGHGTCVDYVNNKELVKIIETLFKNGKVVAAVCHGPIALAECTKKDAKTNTVVPLVQGLTVTGFSNQEESMVQLTDKVPFLIETKFKEQGAMYEKAESAWASKVCVHGNLVTGQNPASSDECANAVVKLLG